MIVDINQMETLKYSKAWWYLILIVLPRGIISASRSDLLKSNPRVMKEHSIPRTPTWSAGCRIYYSDGPLALAWVPFGMDEISRGAPDHKPLEPRLVQNSTQSTLLMVPEQKKQHATLLEPTKEIRKHITKNRI